MSDTQPFRFLDLPKDIRLMVYERLPVKVTHHSLAKGFYVPPNMVLVCKTISGINVLAACRQIHDEANAILVARLATLEGPVRIVTDAHNLNCRDMSEILQCLSAGKQDSARANGPQTATWEIFRDTDHTYQQLPATKAQIPRVVIAVHDPDAWVPEPEAKINRLRFCFGRLFDNIGFVLDEVNATSLIVQVRTALFPAAQKTMFDNIQPLASRPVAFGVPNRPANSDVRVEGGENIEEEEWQKDWTEGERFE
jgi:hypothetical protein